MVGGHGGTWILYTADTNNTHPVHHPDTVDSFLILNMDITTDNSSDFENENRQLLSSFEFLPILASVAASLTIGIISNKVMLG